MGEEEMHLPTTRQLDFSTPFSLKSWHPPNYRPKSSPSQFDQCHNLFGIWVPTSVKASNPPPTTLKNWDELLELYSRCLIIEMYIMVDQ